MSNPGVAAKSPAQMLSEEYFSGKKLFDEYVKLEESDPSAKGRFFREINEALTIHAETEEPLSYPPARDGWTEGRKEIGNDAAEDHPFAGTLFEEMFGLEAEHEQFEATTRMLRDNVEQAAGREE
jgi:hypothetical protein